MGKAAPALLLVLYARALLFPLHTASAQQTSPTRLLEIQALIEQHNLPAARQMAETTRRQHPHDGGLENLLGVIAAQQQQPVAAAEHFGQAIRDRPALLPAYLNLARIYLESPSDFVAPEDKAMALYRRALKLDPRSTEANLQLASLLERHHLFREALIPLAAVADDQPGALVALELRCSAAAATGDQAQADTIAAQLEGSHDLRASDVISMADGLRAGHRADLILRLLNVVQTREQLSPGALELLGLAQDATGDSPAARATLEQAFADSPQSPLQFSTLPTAQSTAQSMAQSAALLLDLARVAEHQGDDQAALGYLAHARELAPQQAVLAFEFSQVCVHMKLLGEARNALERALALEPENALYNLSMGKVTALSQDPLRALPYLKKYQSLQPGDPNAILLLGVVYNQVKDFDSAEPWLRRAAENPATAADAHLYLGSGYRQLGQPDRARNELEQSLKLNDNQAETHAELGLLALQAKSPAEASRELQRAVSLEAQNYTANFGLLQLYAQTGDPRRKEQLVRFEKIKEANETLNRQAMRVIEVSR